MAVSTFRAHCSISHPRIDFAGAEGAAALAAHIKTCKPPVNPHYSKAYNARFLSQRLPAHTLPSAPLPAPSPSSPRPGEVRGGRVQVGRLGRTSD